ncbi:MAG: molecular chaperone [Candidatus Zixiibacteriota bacterium]|nr:MAG: molecular chaperone [candidate division Zixibacteria bacterium]
MNAAKHNPSSLKRIFRRGIFYSFLIALLPAMDILAGVLVAPPVVFMSEKGKAGRITVQNPTNAPKEITISLSFGLPESDSLGNVNIFLNDSTVTDPRSCLEWVKAFPRRLIIPANGSQVVRFVAKPPKNLPDGEYWARVVIEAQEGVAGIPMLEADDRITTKLNMVMRTAIALKYRTGDLVASLEMTGAETRIVDSKVEAMLDFTNKGNCSYVGVLACRLLDANNKEVSTFDLHLAVYRQLRRRIELPIVEGEFQAPYRVEVTVTNRGRKDIPPEEMIYGNDITQTLAVES